MRGDRLPALGPRGEGWVALQFAVLAAVAAAGLVGVAWPEEIRAWLRAAGIAVAAGGGALALAGARTLGRSLTALPRPAEGGSMKGSGIYLRARHPIYGGVLLLAFGVALGSSPWALLPAAVLALVFLAKSLLEEVWLTDRYAEYAEYRRRVRHRFLPFIW